VKEAERCSSNRRPLASVMGALMVADRWPTVRYQPAEPYINRAAPKNRGLERGIEKETEGGEKKESHARQGERLKPKENRGGTEPRGSVGGIALLHFHRLLQLPGTGTTSFLSFFENGGREKRREKQNRETEKTWGKLREEETQNQGEEKATKGRGD